MAHGEIKLIVLLFVEGDLKVDNKSFHDDHLSIHYLDYEIAGNDVRAEMTANRTVYRILRQIG